MPTVRIDGTSIRDPDSFHQTFAAVFGFPDFFGRTWDGWIDCMSSLGDPEDRLTSVHGSATDPVVLRIDNVDAMPADLLLDLVECSAFVNWRNMEVGDPAILVLAFDRTPTRQTSTVRLTDHTTPP